MDMAEMLKQICWLMDAAGVAVIIATRLWWHRRHGWAACGCLLLLIAIGNAILLSTAGLNPGQQAASLFGLVVLGSLGSRFVANWLTEGAA
jgi:hypothetical protein